MKWVMIILLAASGVALFAAGAMAAMELLE